MRFVLGVCVALAVTLMLWAGPAWAVPALQVYIPGADWDPSTQTWVTTSPDFDLWVIGCNTAHDGDPPLTIHDVFLSAALMPKENTNTGAGTITITPVSAPYPAYSPYAAEPAVTPFGVGGQSGWQYGLPVMGDGSPVPGHGIYPTSYVTFDMGDFNPVYDPGAYDMQPGETGSGPGEYKKVHVSITGFEAVHFDAYNHFLYSDKVDARFAPFSHDAEFVPEPGSILLLSVGLAGALGVRLRGRKSKRA